MRPMMAKRKPDVLDSLMSAPMDEEEMPEEAVDSDTAVMSFEDDDEEPAEVAEEGTPEAAFDRIRKGLDELEMMFGQG